MDEAGLIAVAQRLDRLERENRRLKRAGAGVLLLAAAALLGHTAVAGRPRVLEAEAFVLRSQSGATRAVLGVQPDGTVALGLADKDGKVQSGVRFPAGGPSTWSAPEGDGAMPTLRLVPPARPRGASY